jgi:alpha-L-arabinofuranosidase
MTKKLLFIAVFIFTSCMRSAWAQVPATSETFTVHADKTGPTINRDVFGQFAEHLGQGIYEGIWVGKNSAIPNTRGIRKDVVEALRAIKVPIVRWPGGCFADEYHWRKGIGPEQQRPSTINSLWGGVPEPNTFGTDEYMDFLNQIGAEAYVSINMGTGTPQEQAEWLEYMTALPPSSLANERVANGHKEPYKIKYLGLGNESWGCGGPFTADAYVERMKVFDHFVHNFNPSQSSPSPFLPSPNPMKRVAVGPDGAKTEYTEAVMKAWGTRQPVDAFFWNVDGLSLHFYTYGGMPLTAPATDFSEKEYSKVLKETLNIEDIIAKHSAIMDKYDPQKKVALVVDEWGAWLKPMPGTNPAFLKQQNSLRDAILAALNLNIFIHHADRVRMANIAQMVNVIQSIILTDKEKMILTPTYYVYKMYVPFQNATLLSAELEPGEYKFGDITMRRVDGVAARDKDGQVWLAATNIDPNASTDVHVKLDGISAKSATGQVLTADKVDSVNSFEVSNAVVPKEFSAHATNGDLTLHLPAKSVAVVRIQQ